MSSRFICRATVVGLLTAVGAYYLFRQKKRSIPKDWVEVGKVTDLFLYPLKSARRIELQSGECTQYGLVSTEQNLTLRDRSFLVYGEGGNNEFKTGRTHPTLLLIKVSVIDKNHLLLEAPNQSALKLKIPETNSPRSQISLHHGEKIDTIDCGQEAAEWISKYLEKENGYRIGYHDGVFTREIAKTAKGRSEHYKKIEDADMGMYSDITGYHLINNASMDKLNAELEEPMTVHNFRPNILVEGKNCPAFSEEEWDYIKIGTAIFRNVKPCTRCILTTIDPENPVKHPKREPLATLERCNVLKDPIHIQLDGKKAVMGIQIGLRLAGSIKVGDVVYISK